MLAWRPSQQRSFDRIQKSIKLWNVFVQNVFGQSQRNVAHVTTVTLSWRVQNFVVIGWAHTRALPILIKFRKSFDISLVGPVPGAYLAPGHLQQSCWRKQKCPNPMKTTHQVSPRCTYVMCASDGIHKKTDVGWDPYFLQQCFIGNGYWNGVMGIRSSAWCTSLMQLPAQTGPININDLSVSSKILARY